MTDEFMDGDVPITHLLTKKQDDYVCFSFWFKVGSRNENEDFYGLVHLAEHLIILLEIDNETLKDYLNRQAVEYKIFTSVDFVCLQVKCEEKNAIPIFKRICRTFSLLCMSYVNYENEKERVIDEIKINFSNHQKNYFNAIREQCWTENLGHPILGNVGDVGHITFEVAKRVIKKILDKRNLFILYTGSILLSQLKNILNNTLTMLDDIPEGLNEGNPAAMVTHSTLVNDTNVINSSLVYPIKGDFDFKDQLALMIVCRLLAFGNSGKLRASLDNVYYIMAMVLSFKYEKSLVVNFISPSQNAQNLTTKIVKFLNDFVIDDPSKVEIAKRSLVSDIVKASQTDFGSINYIGQAIINYGSLLSFSETLDEIKKLSLSDLSAVMKRIDFNKQPLLIQLDGDEVNYG